MVRTRRTLARMTETAGGLIRHWRRRRHLSQLDLAHRAGVSPRHVSFIENGRSRPTSRMILRLCDHLDVPLREQNRLLLAGGFAPAHPEHSLDAPAMASVHVAIDAMFKGHEPFPAIVIDGGWDLVAANEAAYRLLDGLPAHVLEPPVNVVRLSLDPEGLAPRIANLAQWRAHLLHRIEREYDASGSSRLRALLDELGEGPRSPALGPEAVPEIVVPLRLRGDGPDLSFVSTTTVFGTPREVTVSELAIEAFYPADAETRAALGT